MRSISRIWDAVTVGTSTPVSVIQWGPNCGVDWDGFFMVNLMDFASETHHSAF